MNTILLFSWIDLSLFKVLIRDSSPCSELWEMQKLMAISVSGGFSSKHRFSQGSRRAVDEEQTGSKNWVGQRLQDLIFWVRHTLLSYVPNTCQGMHWHCPHCGTVCYRQTQGKRSHFLQLCTQLVTPLSSVDSVSPMAQEMALGNLNESRNQTESHESGKRQIGRLVEVRRI